MKSQEYELFPGKKLSNLFEDIYNNQTNKKQKISDLIDDIQTKVRHAGDVAVLGAIIKDLIETSVKNDEHLLKLAQVAQRIITSETRGDGDDGILTDAEKKQLLESLDELKKSEDLDDIEDNISGSTGK